MKLEYKILWLDDKIKDFIEDEVIEEIENHINSMGFQPIIHPVGNAKDFYSKLDNSYDLILTDFHMNDIEGDEIVKTIRGSEYSIMTEILFYTAKADLKDAKKIDRVSFLETNSTPDSHIEKVISKTTDLIDLTIKKFDNIIAIRGMIMHETSSLDVEMEMILKQIISNSEEPEKVINIIKSKYKKSNIDFNKDIDNAKDIDVILRIIGATHRWRAIIRNIEKSEIKTIMADYEKEIIGTRNKFAHAELINDNGRQYFSYRKNGLDFNQDFCQKIRENLIKHKNNLDTLKIELKI